MDDWNKLLYINFNSVKLVYPAILMFIIVLKRTIKTKIKCICSSQHCFKLISQQSLLWYPISTKCRAVLPFSRFRRVPKEPYGETRLIIQPQDKGSEPNCCNEAGQLLQETRVVLAASTGYCTVNCIIKPDMRSDYVSLLCKHTLVT